MSEPVRRRRSLFWRVGPLLIGLGAASLLQQLYGTHSVELLCVIPAPVDDGSGVDLRLVRQSDGKLVLRVAQRDRAPGSHTIVIHTKLPRGQYRVEGWIENAPRTPLTADLSYSGEDVVEVPLTRR